MRRRRIALFGIGIVAAATGVLFVACGSSVVGGECADGYELCSLQCVPTGGCSGKGDASVDTTIDSESAVEASPEADISETDGAVRDGDAPDPDGLEVPLGDGDQEGLLDDTGDVIPPPSDLPEVLDVPDVPDVFDVPDNADTPVDVRDGDADSPVDSLETIVPETDGDSTLVPDSEIGTDAGDSAGDSDSSDPFVCESGLLACSSVCIDPAIDPRNCGVCGLVCASGICVGGTCRGSTSGDIAIIGHDYSTRGPASAELVLSNAVYLNPTANPVRILSFEQYADATAVTNVKNIVKDAATARGRTPAVFTSSVSAADVISQLAIAKFDTIIFYDQTTASPGALATLGTSVNATLLAFNRTGGMTIALDGRSGVMETPQFLTAAGLVNASADTATTALTLQNFDPADGLGKGVTSTYSAPTRSVYFTLGEAPKIVVQQQASPFGPVVIHKTVSPP